MGPENRCVSDHVFQRVEPASDSHTARADEGSGEIHQGAIQEYCELPQAKNFQRRGLVDEGMNSKIMSIKRCVGSFRNRENFKTAIFYSCGGLSLDPQ